MVDSLKVSGDEFFKTSQGYNTLPLGTITIQETKAPKGYLLNEEILSVRLHRREQQKE